MIAAERARRERDEHQPFGVAVRDVVVVERLHERHQVRLGFGLSAARLQEAPEHEVRAKRGRVGDERGQLLLGVVDLAARDERLCAEGAGREAQGRLVRGALCGVRGARVVARLEEHAREPEGRLRLVRAAERARERGVRLTRGRVRAVRERDVGACELRRHGLRRRDGRLRHARGIRDERARASRRLALRAARVSRAAGAWSDLPRAGARAHARGGQQRGGEHDGGHSERARGGGHPA